MAASMKLTSRLDIVPRSPVEVLEVLTASIVRVLEWVGTVSLNAYVASSKTEGNLQLILFGWLNQGEWGGLYI
jgi:hypothetical protein